MEEEIRVRTSICKRLKEIYFKEIPWNECHLLVASKFKDLRERAKPFFEDNSSLEALTAIQAWSDEDIKECFVLCGT